MKKSNVAGATVAVVALLAAGSAGAMAAADGKIGSFKIRDDSVRSVDLRDGSVGARDLRPGTVDRFSADTDSFNGAILRSLTYTNGGGGDATVACADTEEESQQYVAVAGGVTADVPSTTTTMNGDFDVAASFPGRMNWETGQPKEGRLDGWVILGAGGHSDTLTVWALCVPADSVEVQSGTLEN